MPSFSHCKYFRGKVPLKGNIPPNWVTVATLKKKSLHKMKYTAGSTQLSTRGRNSTGRGAAGIRTFQVGGVEIQDVVLEGGELLHLSAAAAEDEVNAAYVRNV